MSGSNAGSLGLTATPLTKYVRGFENIQVFTGAGSDTMNFTSVNTGAVTVRLGATGTTGMKNLIGSTQVTSTLVGENKDTAWVITGTDVGTLDGAINFSQFKNITGGTGKDTFNFSTSNAGRISGTIAGGATGVNTILGRNADTTWTLTGSNEGNVTITNASSYVNQFNNIQNLTGGTAADIFDFSTTNFGSLSGLIDGGITGINTIKARTGASNTWTMSGSNKGSLGVTAALPTKYLAGFDDIQVFTGAGSDTMSFASVGTGTVEVRLGATGATGVSNFVGSTQVASTLFGENKDTNWVITGADRGTLNAGTLITFSQFKNITGGTGKDTFNFSTTNTGSISGTIAGGATGINTILGRNVENTWTMKGANNGSLSITNGGNYVTSFVAIQNLNGGNTTDKLIGVNQDNDWNITGDNSGSLGASGSASPVIGFKSIENLVGGQALDKFTFTTNQSSIAGLIDGGSSATLKTIQDSINLAALTGGVAVELGNRVSDNLNLINIESITASAANPAKNIIIGASDNSYRWNITATNTGSIERVTSPSLETSVSFTNFGELRGGSNNDSFNVQATVSKGISGGDGDGIDLVDYSSKNESFMITLGGDGSFGTMGIKDIEGIKGNSDGINDTYKSTISAVNGNNNEWLINGLNDGTVSINGKTVSFENFNQLIGGSGKDSFNYSELGQLVGSIDGGGGNNIIDASGSTLAQEFHLNGTASGVTNLVKINELKGNAANSSLVSTASANTWDVNNQNVGKLNTTFTFSNIANLKGGALADVFNLASIAPFTGIIDGGSGSSVDEINLTQLASDVSVGIGEKTVANLKVTNIESVRANANKTNTLVADNLVENTWVISELNKGTLNTSLSFSGFANLMGRAGADRVTFTNSLSNISGWIDAGEGSDRLDLTTANRDLIVRIASGDVIVNGGEVTAKNFEFIDADETKNNKLIAKDTDNIWTIIATNSGRLSDSTSSVVTNFKNFKNLTGGNQKDIFSFESIGGITGLVDGGEQHDIVDVSKSVNANIVITAENTVSGYRNIEKYIGNNTTSTITGDNQNNNWIIKNNSGTINGSIEFEQFANLVGGSGEDAFSLTNSILSGDIDGAGGADTFTLSGSAIAGELRGGEGNDVFELNVESGFTGSANLLGGQGANRIILSGGGGEGYNATHQQGVLQYTNVANASYTVNYSGIGEIFDKVIADSLTIWGTSEQDIFRLQNNKYQLNPAVSINYSQKQNLVINGSSVDQVILDGDVSIPKKLTVNNTSLISENAGKLTGQSLELVATQNVGSASNRVRLVVDDVYLKSTNGNIYINEQDSLNIKGFSTSATEIFDVTLSGDLLSSVGIAYAGQFNADSLGGDIILNNTNSFTGNLKLKAVGDIGLKNLTSINFSEVAAQNLMVETDGAVTSTGPIVVNGLASISANSAVSLLNADNDFNSLSVLKAESVSLIDKNSLTLAGVLAEGDVVMNTNGAINIGSSCTNNCTGSLNDSSYGIRAANLTLDAGIGSITVGKNITANDSVALQAKGLTVNDVISAKQLTLRAGSGTLLLNDSGNLNGQAGDLIELFGHKVEQHSDITSGGNINITANDDIQMMNGAVTESLSGNVVYNGRNIVLETIKALGGTINLAAANKLEQHSNITSGGNIDITANDDIQMMDGAVTESKSGDIAYSGKNIALAAIKSLEGTVNLTATGAITDSNDKDINIYANRWNADAVAGIGVGTYMGVNEDAIETDVNILSVRNVGKLQEGNGNANTRINILNTDSLIIEQLRNNGDISIVNLTGDFILDNTNNEQFDIGIDDAIHQGGVINANTGVNGGSLTLAIPNGMVTAKNKADKSNPDIIADTAEFIYPENTLYSFGERNRKIVMHVPTRYRQSAKTSAVIWHIKAPLDIVDSSTPLKNIVSNEQLIQIEGLNEIDPAIFTSVSNYIHDEVAILMPADQRFDDDEYAE